MKSKAIQLIDNKDDGVVLDLKINPTRGAGGKITKGIIIGDTLEQNKACILIAQPNDFKGTPTLGVGIEDLLLDDDLLKYRHKIREQFARDGLVIDVLDLYDLNNVEISAHYE